MKNKGFILGGILLAVMLVLGVVSLVDTDPTVSLVENRKLATKPAFSAERLFSGQYLSELDTYYNDTFPLRERLFKANQQLNGFYHYSGRKEENNVLLIGANTGAEEGGVSLADYERAQAEQENPTKPDKDPAQDPALTDPNAPTEPEDPNGGEDPEQLPPDEPERNVLDEVDAAAKHDSGWTEDENASYEQAGAVMIIGKQGMEVPSKVPDVITSYANVLNTFAEKMPDVQVYSLITPNAAEFYSPLEFHTGSHSQKDMISSAYSQMTDDIIKVDIYSKLAERTDQYIYFRTDHHWTARGAYFAYVAFCEAKGIDPVSLEDFESGRYDEFVGSLYTFTRQYPQSEVLWNNPDYVEYFLPIVESHAKYYMDATLTNGIPIYVVSTNISNASKQDKYLCFISGDTPICVIETAVEDGPTCVVLKESYGNAFVPFLTSHYSKIIVIDPREFNHGSKPYLDLVAFAQEQEVDDLLVINYPFMINNAAYVGYLRALVAN